jgi:cell wall-associated NlpC family hydrolase
MAPTWLVTHTNPMYRDAALLLLISMVHIEDVLLQSLAQEGDNYVFCAAVDFADPDPRDFDCSGLVQWSCQRRSVQPRLPRSSFEQARHCIQNGREIAVVDAVATRGALLFKFTPGIDLMTIKSRPETAHVAWSLGNGTTIEAHGPKTGVGSFSSNPTTRKWTHAALIPGVDYDDRRPVPNNPEEEEPMPNVMYFRGPEGGQVHAYVVTGGIGKLLSPEALGLQCFFKTPVVGSLAEPLGKEWQDSIAILDGPLRNIH